MNSSDLKRLRINEQYVMTPLQFLVSIGIATPNLHKNITIHDLHYILQENLHHAGLKNVSADKIYRGEIILIGTLNNFYPYYNPTRSKTNELLEVPGTSQSNSSMSSKQVKIFRLDKQI